MKTLHPLTTGLVALAISACGNAQDSGADAPAAPPAAAEALVANGQPAASPATGGVADATGTIVSLGELGDFVTIDHGPFEGGFAMGAMTMGFETVADADLSGFSEGDEVAIRVKQGRDGAYRIMAICNTATDGADCLDEAP